MRIFFFITAQDEFGHVVALSIVLVVCIVAGFAFTLCLIEPKCLAKIFDDHIVKLFSVCVSNTALHPDCV